MPWAIMAWAFRGTALCKVIPQGPLRSMHPNFPCHQPVTGCIGSDKGIPDYFPEWFITVHAMDTDLFYKAIDEGLDIMGHCLVPAKPNKKVKTVTVKFVSISSPFTKRKYLLCEELRNVFPMQRSKEAEYLHYSLINEKNYKYEAESKRKVSQDNIWVFNLHFQLFFQNLGMSILIGHVPTLNKGLECCPNECEKDIVTNVMRKLVLSLDMDRNQMSDIDTFI
jgi:hypothetical protein